MKITTLADVVHESIPVSQIEKSVLSTIIFNRLHNVLQNSTLYLTFPSARHSRFSHSLGVMHIAGKIFESAIHNSQSEIIRDLIDEIRTIYKSIIESTDFKKMFRDIAPKQNDDPGYNINEDPIKDYIMYNDDFFKRVAILCQSDNDRLNIESYNLLCISIQATRLAALLHDIGHPPFSHVVEFAIEEIYRNLSKDHNINNSFVEVFPRHFSQTGSKFHELIGDQLIDHIINESIRDSCEHLPEYPQLIFNRLIVFFLAKKILDKLFNTPLDNIISSYTDADRIDFVSRDLMMTSLSKSITPHERMISSFKISKKKDGGIIFAPSATSISSVEFTLERRFDFYRYAVNHHRVKKTDGFLRRILVSLSLNEIRNESSKTEANKVFLLPDIGNLWKILEINLSQSADKHRLSQWDDAWLITLLRHQYYINNQLTAIEKSMILEIISGRKIFHSLWKRIDGYMHIDNELVNLMIKDIDENKIYARDDNDDHDHVYNDRIYFWENLKKRKVATENMSTPLSTEGVPIMSLISNVIKNYHKSISRIMNSIEIEIANKTNKEIMIEYCSVNTGIKDDAFVVDASGNAVDLSTISNISKRLQRRARYVPPFFVYTIPYNKHQLDTTDRKSIDSALPGVIWEILKAEPEFNNLLINPKT